MLTSMLVQLFAAAPIASQASSSTDLFDQLSTRMMAKRQSIQSIRARFTEMTTSSLLEKPLVSHGTVTAAPPAGVLGAVNGPVTDGTFQIPPYWVGRSRAGDLRCPRTWPS
jgi:hypothetical protein